MSHNTTRTLAIASSDPHHARSRVCSLTHPFSNLSPRLVQKTMLLDMWHFPSWSSQNLIEITLSCDMTTVISISRCMRSIRHSRLTWRRWTSRAPPLCAFNLCERHGRIQDLDSLCDAVMLRFYKDQYHIQLCRLDSLKQMGFVVEYQEKFEALAHGIFLYKFFYDATLFVTKLLGGLKEKICTIIALHRPKDGQTTTELAMLSDIELENCRVNQVVRMDSETLH